MKTKIWNLTELKELNETVTVPFEIVPKRKRVEDGTLNQWGGFRSVALVAATTALTMAIGTGYATQSTFSMPLSPISQSESIIQPPPLSKAFVNQYVDGWSKNQEENLLLRLSAKQDAALNKEDVIQQTVESVFYNLQEDVDSDSNRLPRAEIEKIVRRHKLQ